VVKVSVIIPVYNGEETITATINSILAQSERDLEVIAIDDGSTDGTLAALEAIRDDRLVVVQRKHGGIVKALNAGIEVSRGAYIARIDAGDIAEPTRLRKQVDFLERVPEVGLLGTWAFVVDEAGRMRVKKMPETDAAIRNAFFFICPFIHPSTMFRREVLERAGWYDEREDGSLGLGWEDYELWMRMLSVTKGYNLPEALVTVRRSKMSVTRRMDLARTVRCRLAVRRKIIRVWRLPVYYNVVLAGIVLFSIMRRMGVEFGWVHSLMVRVNEGLLAKRWIKREWPGQE
jgi:glycosyltransferase involved in cell wall biosynthesis